MRQTHNSKRCTGKESTKKATYEDSLQVLGYRDGDLEDCEDKHSQKQRTLPTVQFRQGAEDNRTKGEAEHEQTDA